MNRQRGETKISKEPVVRQPRLLLDLAAFLRVWTDLDFELTSVGSIWARFWPEATHEIG